MKKLIYILLGMIILTLHTHAVDSEIEPITPSEKIAFIIQEMRKCPFGASCVWDSHENFRVKFYTPAGVHVFGYEIDALGNEKIAILVSHSFFKGDAQKLFMVDENLDGCVNFASTALPSHAYERNAHYPCPDSYDHELYWQDQYEKAYTRAYEYVRMAQYYK